MRMLAFFTVVAIAGCSSARVASNVAIWNGGNWPTYQYSPNHNAVIDSPDAPRIIRWNTDLKAKINGGLAYSGGLVYVTTFDYRVLALRALDGTVAWQKTFDNIIMSTPVISGRTMVIGTGDNGMPVRGDATFAYASLLTQTRPFWGREGGDHIIALDPSDGKQRWSFHTAGQDMPSPVITNGQVVFDNGDAHAYGLQLSSGEIKWQTQLSGIATMASAAALGDTIFVSTCSSGLKGETHALGRTGALLWSTPYGDCDSAPTLGGGHLFLSGVRTNRLKSGYGGSPNLAAVDPRTGKLQWAYQPRESGYFTRVASSERAIAGLYDNGAFIDALPTLDQLVAIDSQSGRVRWIAHSMAPIKMSPIASEGRIYVGDIAGILYTINEQTGDVESTRMFGGPFTTSPPIVVNETLYVVNATSVYAIPLNTLTQK